jgi:hypothetical protein
MRKKAFDPGEPFDAMFESFRTQVVDMAIKAREAAIYRDMPEAEQLSCLMAGVMTGMMGVTMVLCKKESWPDVRDLTRAYVDKAAETAAEIIQKSGARHES